MKYTIKCSLDTDITAEAKAMYVRLAGFLLPRLDGLNCKLVLESTKLDFKPAWFPSYLDNCATNYVAVFETSSNNYAAQMNAIFESLAQDFGIGYVDVTIDRGIGDPCNVRLDSATTFAEAYTKAYPEFA